MNWETQTNQFLVGLAITLKELNFHFARLGVLNHPEPKKLDDRVGQLAR